MVYPQHSQDPQSSSFVSSGTLEFFRAQGTPITMELPFSSKSLGATQNAEEEIESDFTIRSLAKSLGLHVCFGPLPSVAMLLEEILELTKLAHLQQQIIPSIVVPPFGAPKRSSLDLAPSPIELPDVFPIFIDRSISEGAISKDRKFQVDDNAPTALAHDLQIVPYNASFAREQILNNLHSCVSDQETATDFYPAMGSADSEQETPLEDGHRGSPQLSLGHAEILTSTPVKKIPTTPVAPPRKIAKRTRKIATPLVVDGLRSSAA